ncbi:hypothetical protein Nepgr_020028 [Nepenthes gracilis]|uniref:TATA-box-binding protein n=1 Tax=Nepenthes gracilis TaxID=150966 RepID=A0AAD3SWB5_NEPGR|nr:hypothetical protein Nepgr_020028 [Nepenthes gracilis]
MFAENAKYLPENLDTHGTLLIFRIYSFVIGGDSRLRMAEQGLEGSQPVDLSKHPSGIVPTLQNIVSTVNLDCKLDLKAIALQARNAEYNPKRFAAVIMRIREPKTTALIFASGKMVCTGAKSEHQSKLAARKYARIIQKLGFPAKFKDFKIQNIVGSCDVKFPIRLEGLAYSHGAFSSYEPELFPGLIYRMKQPKIELRLEKRLTQLSRIYIQFLLSSGKTNNELT